MFEAMNNYVIGAMLFSLIATGIGCDEGEILDDPETNNSSLELNENQESACVFYVDESKNSGGDGLSWETAMGVLENAIENALALEAEGETCEIWNKGSITESDNIEELIPASSQLRVLQGFEGHEIPSISVNYPLSEVKNANFAVNHRDTSRFLASNVGKSNHREGALKLPSSVQNKDGAFSELAPLPELKSLSMSYFDSVKVGPTYLDAAAGDLNVAREIRVGQESDYLYINEDTINRNGVHPINIGESVNMLNGSSSAFLKIGRNSNENITFDVTDNNASMTYFQDSDCSQNIKDHILMFKNDANGCGRDDIEFWVNGQPSVTFAENGNVGIGTNAPSARLDIEDSDTYDFTGLEVSANQSNPFPKWVGVKFKGPFDAMTTRLGIDASTWDYHEGDSVSLMESSDYNHFIWALPWRGSENRYQWGIYWSGDEGAVWKSGDRVHNPNEIVFVGSGDRKASISLQSGNAHFNVITAKEIEVKPDYWADFVFEEDYPLMNLEDVKSYIEKNKHLPGVPSAIEVTSDGISIGENQAVLLKKIEELTLYVISQQEEIEALKKKMNDAS